VFGAVEAAVRGFQRVETFDNGVGGLQEQAGEDARGVDGAVGVPQVVAARDHDFHWNWDWKWHPHKFHGMDSINPFWILKPQMGFGGQNLKP
jgi:hypothetical protein